MTQTGWLVAAFAPPVAAATAWQHAVSHHLALTIIVGAIYEVAVATVGFAGGITTDLAQRWQKRIADRIDLAVQRRTSRFHRRYREFVLGGLRFIDLKGLGTIGPFTPELGDVYVDVSLTHRPFHEIRADVLSEIPNDVTKRHALEELIGQTKPVVLAVLGAPGSGKTTLLRHTARRICLSRARQGNSGRNVPILLYLRDHVSAITTQSRIELTDLVLSTLGNLAETQPYRWFEQRLRAGECTVLLDGLDEVARPEDRKSVVAWVERQIRYYPNNDYVITSRPHGYPAEGISGAAVLQVRNFTDEQVVSFVNGWYLAVERHSTGSEDQDVDRRADLAAKDLLKRLDRAPALRELTVNPLLLTMIANVHRYRGALPGSRADLYAEICQVMLFRRQEAKNLAVQWPGDKKEALLRRLAYAMMQRKLSDLPQHDIYAEFKPALDRLPFRVTAEDFLSEVVVSGLLVEREIGVYSFAHHTFQEYLAAAHIRDRNLIYVLTQAVDDPWWRETTLLYSARSDADQIIAACLDSTNIAALALAFDCADQGSEFSASLRGRLDNLLDTATDPETNRERRRLVIGALLTRHLTQQIKASDGSRICVNPITTRLYRFFMHDTGLPPPDGSKEGSKGGGLASGLHASDARAFVQWVNLVTERSVIYRLPNDTALADAAVQRLLTGSPGHIERSVWVEARGLQDESHKNGSAMLWVPPGVQHPYFIEADAISKNIRMGLAHESPTITRLVILRSAFMIRALSHAFILARTQNQPKGSFICRSFDRSLDAILRGVVEPTLTYALDQGLALDESCALVTRWPLTTRAATGFDLARALDRAGGHALRRALEYATNATEDPDAEPKFGLELGQILGHVLDLDRELAVDHSASNFDLRRALVGATIIGRGYEGFFEADFYNIVGHALSRAISDASHGLSQRDFNNFSNGIAKAFTSATGLTEGSIASPDLITEKLTSALRAFNGLIVSVPSGAMQSPWAATVSRRLGRIANPVRTESDVALHFRLPALCLAAEADALGQQQIGDRFREIAASATLLKRRLAGDAPTNEVILLSAG
jgi:hypothetical protein